MAYLYPGSPQNIDVNLSKPSPVFKSKVRRVVVSLVLFALIYISLLAVGIALAAAFAVMGGAIIFYIHNIFAIAFGAGLIVAGGMILYFLVKFIFETKKSDKANHTEIFEKDYPELFDFVRKLSAETGTDFPLHIYISPDVNAAVFYDSNIRSMFFPVKKNLLIGMGLVNMVNLSEFKAVLAHEFGHFSQKSMRAGSYVYQVNRAIYNMLFENKSYNNVLASWASMHSAFAMCANITVKIVSGIQAVQQQAYKLVNKQYSQLSQQMEFHADAIAATAAGSNNMIYALRRVDFGDDCYSAVLYKYNEWIEEGLKGNNVFAHQRIVAAGIASRFRLPLNEGLPLLNGEHNLYNSNTRVSIDDQWASHPTMQQREAALSALQCTGEVVNESAWVLFGDTRALQEKLTVQLYTPVKFKKKPEVASEELFAGAFEIATKENSFPDVYDLYFRNREISKFDPERPGKASDIQDISVFFTEHALINSNKAGLEKDINLLTQIIANPKQVRSFNYNGNRYKQKYAATVLTTLEAELKQTLSKLQEYDEAAFGYFMLKATTDAEKDMLRNHYKYYFQIQELKDEYIVFCNHLVTLIQPCSDNKYFKETVTKMAGEVAEAAGLLISKLQKTECFFDDPALPYKFSLPETITAIKTAGYTYVNGEKFATKELQSLFAIVHELANWSYSIIFQAQKQLLEKQAGYLA